MRLFKTAILSGAIVALSSPAFAVDAVKVVPMVSDNMPAIGEFKYDINRPIPTPVITWGADVATLYANGSSEVTTTGSLLEQVGVKLSLSRQDNFRQQVRDFRSGNTPFLRGTTDMITAASEALCDDQRTCPQIFYALSRSAGGDILVGNTNKGVTDVSSLRGKTIGLQLDGPHMNLLIETLSLGGMTVNDVNIKWYKDLGFDGSASAAHAFQAGEVDAAFVIFPDALELTEGDGQVSGAKNIFSTKSVDRVIYDVYAVRPDFASAHPEVIEAMTNALLRGSESLSAIIKRNGEPSADSYPKTDAEYKKVAASGAKLLFGIEGDVTYDSTVMEMFTFDLKMLGWTGNVKFLTDPGTTKGVVWYGSIAKKAATAFADVGLMKSSAMPSLVAFAHNFEGLKAGLTETFGVEAPVINTEAAARAVEQLGAQGVTDQSIVSFEIRFGANQTDFSADLYASDFERVLDVMTRAGGAVVAVEGHSGTYKYLLAKYGKNAVSADQWREIAQSNRNLSHERARSVVSALETYATQSGYDVSFANVVPIGVGISKPSSGMCSWTLKTTGQKVEDPCGPADKKSGAAWEDNEARERRVVFSVVNVEGEAEVFADDAF